MTTGSRPPAAAAPLWVWRATGIGALLLLGLLVGLALWSERRMSRRLTTDAETLLRREWTARSDSVMRVVVLGTSLVEYGVADADYFARQCGRQVRVVKLFCEAVNVEGFTDASPIFQLLERYPPHVLCIEENLLLFRLPYSMKPGLNKRLPEVLNQHLAMRIATLKVRLGWPTADGPKRNLFQGFPPEHHRLNKKDTLDVSPTLTEIRSRPVRTARRGRVAAPTLATRHPAGVAAPAAPGHAGNRYPRREPGTVAARPDCPLPTRLPRRLLAVRPTDAVSILRRLRASEPPRQCRLFGLVSH